MTIDNFEPIVEKVCEIPKILKRQLFERIKVIEKLDEKAEKIPKQSVINFWKKHFEHESIGKRVFKLFAQPDTSYIVPDDFKSLFKNLLETHPGLEFLQATPEFQERYADTVVMRIFFTLDTNDDSRITWRDFKNSNLLETFFQVSSENDINMVR